MAHEYRLIRHVEFADTDMAGIVHFTAFFRYMEAAEHAFFRSLGFSIYTREAEPVGWPRVHADCDFVAPLRFEDSVEIQLLVRERREKSIVYSFIFRKLNDEDSPRIVARGSLVVACVKRDASGRMTSVAIPQAIAERIETAPAELLNA